MSRKILVIVGCAAAFAALEAHAQQELRATVNLTITNTSNTAFSMNVANNSTAPYSITGVLLSLAGANVDTFGTFSVAITQLPNTGANNDGSAHPSVNLTPTSPIMPGQSFSSVGGDIDNASPTSVTFHVTFSDGTTITSAALALSGTVYSANLVRSSVPTYPVSLSWVNPTLNVDATPYTNPAGTKLYWGTTTGGPYANSVTLNNPAETQYVMSLPLGSYYFVATAFSTSGAESAFSNQAVGVADPTPGVPTGLEQMQVDPEALGIAWLVFTIRNQVLFAEAGTARPGAACDPQQYARGILPTDQMPHTLHLVAVEDVQLLGGLQDGEFALFAQCSAP